MGAQTDGIEPKGVGDYLKKKGFGEGPAWSERRGLS